MVTGFSLEIRFPQQRRHPCCKGPDPVVGVGVGDRWPGPLVTCPQVVHMDTQQHTSDEHMEDGSHVQGEQSSPVPMGALRQVQARSTAALLSPRTGGPLGRWSRRTRGCGSTDVGGSGSSQGRDTCGGPGCLRSGS